MALTMGSSGVSPSGLFVDTVGRNFYAASGSPVRADWTITATNGALKIALFQDSLTSGSTGAVTSTNYAALNPAYGAGLFVVGGGATGEVPQANAQSYLTGGQALSTPTVAQGTGSTLGALNFNVAAFPAWGTVSSPALISGAHGGLIFNDYTGGPAKQAWCLLNFGADYSITGGGGSFSVIFGSDGIFSIDVTP